MLSGSREHSTNRRHDSGYDVVVERTRPQRRADAERNRGRIIASARRAFAEQGLDAPLEDVAEGAGVGIGTVYRHFPTRDDLVTGCFAERLAVHVEAAEEALKAPDGWTGFVQYVERTCALQAADRGLNDLLASSFPAGHALEQSRLRVYELVVRIIDRAKAEGALRDDAVPEDYPLILMANAGVVQGMGTEAPDAWRRYIALMLQGFRARSDEPVLPPPPTPRQVVRATLRLGRSAARLAARGPRPKSTEARDAS